MISQGKQPPCVFELKKNPWRIDQAFGGLLLNCVFRMYVSVALPSCWLEKRTKRVQDCQVAIVFNSQTKVTELDPQGLQPNLYTPIPAP